ncbi:hypothetical protein SRABI84_01354 [Peribacillus simplex]|uniref:hypothetical protein n=1 Tax=Peribacillus simplex TaxID=1478 RepID=UPI001D9C91B6|nr:hypothetical protein [Peribacillus simplex]CAH0178052.1 hypothetical protein SRABI84_01354 [Peribacillus simplex]
MNLKGRLDRIQSKLPQKEENQPKDIENVGVWLIENNHQEFIDCVRRTWRISIKGELATDSERSEYERLLDLMDEIKTIAKTTERELIFHGY